MKDKINKLFSQSNINTITNYGELALKVADIITRISHKPKKTDYLALGLTSFSVISEIYNKSRSSSENGKIFFIQSYLDKDKEWEESWELCRFQKFLPEGKLLFKDNKIEVFETTINNTKLFYGRYGAGSGIYKGQLITLYHEKGKKQEITTLLREKIWKYFISKKIHISLQSYNDDSDYFIIPEFYSSSKIRKLEDRIEKFLEKNVKRSIILHGPPGAGKTTFAKFISNKKKIKTVRLTIEFFSNEYSLYTGGNDTEKHKMALDFIKNLQPELLIIDDIDRVDPGRQNELLTFLEEVPKYCKIVIFSANHKNKITKALLRPGRVDEHYFINGTEEEMLEKILGEEDKDLFPLMKDYPVAYVWEYKKRKEVLGKETARKELDELTERVKENLEEYKKTFETTEKDEE